jgi:ABC-type multidrug transport system ATPase subunit
VILVTHQIQHLKEVKKIVVLDQGKIKMEGTYQELKHLGLDFDKILETYHDRDEKEDEIFDVDEEDDEDYELDRSHLPPINKNSISKNSQDDLPIKSEIHLSNNGNTKPDEGTDIIEKESRDQGEVPFTLWFKFYNYG